MDWPLKLTTELPASKRRSFLACASLLESHLSTRLATRFNAAIGVNGDLVAFVKSTAKLLLGRASEMYYYETDTASTQLALVNVGLLAALARMIVLVSLWKLCGGT